MPLLNHFQPPLSRHVWQSFHSAWTNAIMAKLNAQLPQRYIAVCDVHLGRAVAADVAEFDRELLVGFSGTGARASEGGVATEVWAPPAVAHTVPAVFPDDLEVQILDQVDGMRVVAVVEIVSPGNKDRDEYRDAFADKCGAYLQRGIGLVIVDAVSERRVNLHNRLMQRLQHPADVQMPDDALLYATSYRPAVRDETSLIDLWLFRLAVGETLPTVPLAIRGAGVVPLELEAPYTAARHASRLS